MPGIAAMPAAKGGGFIQIGQVFGNFLQPYIDAAVQALLAALVGWLCLELKKRTGIEIDEKHRAAFTHALTNQVGSLIADGLVKIEGEEQENDSLEEPRALRSAQEAHDPVNDGTNQQPFDHH